MQARRRSSHVASSCKDARLCERTLMLAANSSSACALRRRRSASALHIRAVVSPKVEN